MVMNMSNFFIEFKAKIQTFSHNTSVNLSESTRLFLRGSGSSPTVVRPLAWLDHEMHRNSLLGLFGVFWLRKHENGNAFCVAREEGMMRCAQSHFCETWSQSPCLTMKCACQRGAGSRHREHEPQYPPTGAFHGASFGNFG